MKTKVKSLAFYADFGGIDKKINQALGEIEKNNNNIIEDIKIIRCGQSNICVLIIYKELVKSDSNNSSLTF